MYKHTSKSSLVGYEELIRRYSLQVLPHYVTSYVTETKGRRQTVIEGHRRKEFYPLTYHPGDELGSHLIFALKHEGLNLEIINAVFEQTPPSEIEDIVRKTPTGKYARQIWFLYEFLIGKTLDLEPVKVANYVDLLDEDLYVTANKIPVSRQKVNNNLLGHRRFCPLIRKTDFLKKYMEIDFQERTKQVIDKYPEDILQRAISYLFTKETKSSFEIERTTPDQKRAARFVELLKIAEETDFFTKDNLINLQQSIVDSRFANEEFRKDQNYVGQSIGFGREMLHFISPKPEDLPELMEGMFECHKRMAVSKVHPVIAATIIAFGFVFMHPFDDGNGRIHRFLIHNILANTKFTPEGLIFPVSATLVQNIKEYDQTLELFSKPLLHLIDYQLTDAGEMTVMNETALYYRYIDMTAIAENMFRFIETTIEKELASELDLLINYEKAKSCMQEIIDMPDRMIDLFMRMCRENGGRLSQGKRKSMFSKLTDEEVVKLEECIKSVFGLT
jgi:hypothetical protein